MGSNQIGTDGEEIGNRLEVFSNHVKQAVRGSGSLGGSDEHSRRKRKYDFTLVYPGAVKGFVSMNIGLTLGRSRPVH